MSGDYRATPELWARAEEDADRWVDATAFHCLLELRARVEALEAAQQPTVKESLTDQTAPVATRELWELWHCAERPTDAFRAIYDLGRQHGAAQATCPHIVSSDEGTSYCRLAEQGAAPATEESSALAPTDSLVERVAGAIAGSDDPHELWYHDARAAIREVATWLSKESDGHLGSGAHWAGRLQREANQ